MNLIKPPLNNLLIAVGFLTRIPIANWVSFNQVNLGRSTYFFPVVAWLLTLLLVFIYSLFCFVFPQNISVILLIICGVLVTGALHEDGLADFCDAIGVIGGHDQKMSAMKDSRLGVFGVLALIFAIGGKYLFIGAQQNIILALLISLSLSRMFAFSFMVSDDYFQTQKSKSKGFVPLNSNMFLLVLAVCCLPAVFLLPWYTSLVMFLVLCILRFLLIRMFRKHIGGVNGDCMGASQQVSELLILLVLI